jgi:hypothetical protein
MKSSLCSLEFGWRKHQDIDLQSGKLAINGQVSCPCLRFKGPFLELACVKICMCTFLFAEPNMFSVRI